MVNLTEIQSEAHTWSEPSLFCQDTCKQMSPVLKTQAYVLPSNLSASSGEWKMNSHLTLLSKLSQLNRQASCTQTVFTRNLCFGWQRLIDLSEQSAGLQP